MSDEIARRGLWRIALLQIYEWERHLAAIQPSQPSGYGEVGSSWLEATPAKRKTFMHPKIMPQTVISF
jgi:hypothetical protein